MDESALKKVIKSKVPREYKVKVTFNKADCLVENRCRKCYENNV